MCWCRSCNDPDPECQHCDRWYICELCREDFDADELGLDPEEEWDYDATA